MKFTLTLDLAHDADLGDVVAGLREALTALETEYIEGADYIAPGTGGTVEDGFEEQIGAWEVTS